MANPCGYILPLRYLFLALIFCLAMAILISTTHMMQLNLDKITEDVVELFDDAYHSEGIFRIDYGEMEKNFKIYMYPQGQKCSDYDYEETVGKYANEGYFFKNIKRSTFLTHDPEQAHLFFIPISLQKIYFKEQSYTKVEKEAERCVKNLILKYPYWNRTMGADHFILTCLDHDVSIPILEKNTIRIVCSSTYASNASRFIPHKDITLPSAYTKPLAGKHMHKRVILGYWAGFCNSNTRKKLVDLWGRDAELKIQNTTLLDGQYGRMMNFHKAKFCICPAGSRITNIQIIMSIHHGCVPVIMDDYLDLPFNDILDWTKFSIVVRENHIYLLHTLLSYYSDDEYTGMHTNLMEVKTHFEWNSPPVKYDAFHMVLYELWLRRHLVKY